MTEKAEGFAEVVGRAWHAAHDEAKKSGVRVIEAEHLLLALAAESDGACGRLLREWNLGRARLEDALAQERKRSLAFAQVEPLPPAQAMTSRYPVPIRAGTSLKVALRRGRMVGPAHYRPRRGTDVLLGILEAGLGTVPRALALAGVDREEMIAEVNL